MAKGIKPTTVLLVAGGGLAAYHFVVKPWLAAQGPGAATAGASLLPSFLPSPAVSTPTVVGSNSVNPGGIQSSIVDPRVTVGGDVGQAMWKKGWTYQQASTRLNQLKAAVAAGQAALQQLKGGAAGQYDANIQAGLQAAAANDNAAAAEEIQYQRAYAAGDNTAAAPWKVAADAHRRDAAEIRQRVQQLQASPNTAAQIAAWEGAIAGHKADYFALTGLQLAV